MLIEWEVRGRLRVGCACAQPRWLSTSFVVEAAEIRRYQDGSLPAQLEAMVREDLEAAARKPCPVCRQPRLPLADAE